VLAAFAALLLVPGVAAAAPAPIYNVHYGPGSEEYGMVLPAPATGAKPVLFVHGGWGMQQRPGIVKAEADMLRIQERGGFMVYAIDYPQTCRPRWPVECGVSESRAVVAAFRWLRAHAAEYGGDPDHIQLFGSSAGGTFVERAANWIEVEEPDVLPSVTELSAPWLNLVTFVQELEDGESGSGGDLPTAHYLDCATTKPISGCSLAAEERESPILDLPPDEGGPPHPLCAPQWISWGEVKDQVDKQQSIEYAAALEADGCEVTRHPARSGHAIDYFREIERPLYAFWNAH
jgi:acetyl esterase/lipase